MVHKSLVRNSQQNTADDMEHNPSNSSSRTERKIVEKNRRNQMTALYSKLHSLVPRQASSEAVSLSDQIGEAANYIKKLENDLEKMKEKKDRLRRVVDEKPRGMRNTVPQIEIHEMGSALEVVLITGLDCSQSMFKEIIRVFHEEGAEIVNASFSVADDVVFHTVHSKCGESGLGCGAARITERLMKFVYDST